MNRWHLHHGESLRWLEGLDSGSADALITDPPYSSGGAFRGDRATSTATKYVQTESVRGGRGVGKLPSFDGDTRDQRTYALWCERWLGECYRVVRPGGVVAVFIDWRQLPTMTDALQMAGWVWRGIAVWDKTQACRPQPGRFRAQAEYVVWGSRGELVLQRDAPVLPGVITHYQQSDDRHHQTGKPLSVMRQVVKFCERGGIILDPFTGSATTGVAALLEGFGFLGCEWSDEYYDVAQRRLEAAAQGIVLASTGGGEQLGLLP